MATSHSPRRRLAQVGAAIGIVSAAVAAGTVAGAAGHANPISRTDPPGYHPASDSLGSQVAKHEPVTNPVITPNVTGTRGLDVSSHQGNVNWSTVAANGAKFVYVKATENNDYRNPYFGEQYTGAYNHGLIHGAYHFAIPNGAGPVYQADYFVHHGGGWSKDGRTLPPMLDIEYNPYGGMCYGKSKSAMVGWISTFVNRVHRMTSRWPTIYTSNYWWRTCTGNTGAFNKKDPLFIARYASTAGTLPGGWPFWTFWQYADSGIFPGDQDVFNGSYTRLKVLALG